MYETEYRCGKTGKDTGYVEPDECKYESIIPDAIGLILKVIGGLAVIYFIGYILKIIK